MNCINCNNPIPTDTTTYYITHDGDYVCQDCYDDTYFTCDYCGDVYHTDYLYNTEDYRYPHICTNCYSNHFFTCDGCDNTYHEDDLYYDDDHDRNYCHDCYDEHHHSSIVGYHDTEPFNFYATRSLTPTSTPDPNELYLGCELEIEKVEHSDYSINDIADYALEHLPVQCSEDGSLSYGFEMVWDAHTWEAHKERTEEYKEAFKFLIDNGMRGDETSTCGLHVHVSRAPLKEDTISKILVFMENYKEELINFARRGSNHYSQFLSDYDTSTDYTFIKSLEYAKKSKPQTRYMALNLTNDHTIEFRLFKSTLNHETFMATLNLVNNIVKVCDTTDINEITWEKVVNYDKSPWLHDYLDRRGILTTSTKLEDNSKEYREYLNKEEKLKALALKTMNRELQKCMTKIHDLARKSIDNITAFERYQRAEYRAVDIYNEFVGCIRNLSLTKARDNLLNTIISTPYMVADDIIKEMINNVYNSCKE